MAALDIRPHSQRLSLLAVAGLAVLALGGFAAGLGRQIASASAPSPFPPPQEKSLRIEVANGVAPAPIPVAPPKHAPRTPAPDDTLETAQAPPAADASALVADPPSLPHIDAPAPSEPQPADDPPTL
jgi:hypothetical protein